MTSLEKIRSEHLNRRACVYLRQSTMAQLVEHTESTARQYALQSRATELGWPAEQVQVIDEDLGHSGQTAEGRNGFQRLAEDVAHGRVGAIFAVEVSRLARSSADWHKLLELCSLADVVIADENTVYRPHADYNDRLLLGFKGQMSEAESYWMRLRLHGAKLSKARRGELTFPLPPGLAWAGGKIAPHPDEGVRKALALVFERFRLDGSIGAVTRYLRHQGIRLPIGHDEHGSIRWDKPRYRHVQSVLKNPLYAGAYVFGRRRQRMGLVDGQVRRHTSTTLPMESWPVFLRDAHPGYISWEEYMANQKKIRENLSNRRWPDQRGAARDGMGLLQGLVLCGRCSRRMRMRYMGRENLSYYVCDKGKWEDMACAVCWTVATPPIDEAVEKLFLETMQPPELDLSLVVAREVEKQAAEVDKQWQLRLERARYEARQAERRYRAVDAENRLVARTLERDWEEKLREVTELEREHEEVRRREHLELTDYDRKAILALAKDLPRVWRAPTTTGADRKNLLRMVIREVVLQPIDVPRRATSVQILWQTGHSTTLEVLRRGRGQHIATSADAVAVIRELTTLGKTDEEIAEELNRRELRTGTGKSWSANCVLKVRNKRKLFKPKEHRYRSQPMPDRRGDGAYSVRGAAKVLGVTPSIIYYWNKTGRLRGTRDGENGAWWFDLDGETVQRLRRQAAE